jgi:hypothetical protein
MGIFRKVLAWMPGAVGAMIALSTQVSPETATSNLSGWARLLHLNWIAGHLPANADALGVVVAILLILLSFSIFWARSQGKRWSAIFAASKSALVIEFNAKNPGRKFWSIENPTPGIPRAFWEYRVAIKNKSAATIRNVSVTVERIGQMPVRPESAPFDRDQRMTCDLKPGCSELAVVLRWPTRPEAGMLAGPSALAYGPIKIIASGDDVPVASRVFQFDYQRTPMLFE